MDRKKTSYPKEKIKVLLLENISEITVKNFERNGYTQVQRLSKALPEADLIEAVRNVHIIENHFHSKCFREHTYL